MPLLPPGLRAFALYVRAHAAYLSGDYAHSLGIAETALLAMDAVYPIPSIYLHLVAVMDLVSLRRADEAHTRELTAEPASSVRAEPTCTEAGVRVYTATVELDGAKYTATSEQAIPALGHDFQDGPRGAGARSADAPAPPLALGGDEAHREQEERAYRQAGGLADEVDEDLAQHRAEAEEGHKRGVAGGAVQLVAVAAEHALVERLPE